jgi:metal-responsive CopG/Arc/MetJ family transcriptional regulator
MSTKIIRTTLALPADLIAAADRMVQGGVARSRNELIASALRHELETRHREAVDASIASMAYDDDYLSELQEIMGEFATADIESMPEPDELP